VTYHARLLDARVQHQQRPGARSRTARLRECFGCRLFRQHVV